MVASANTTNERNTVEKSKMAKSADAIATSVGAPMDISRACLTSSPVVVRILYFEFV